MRWEKHPSAYFYYHFLKCVLKWRVHSHLSLTYWVYPLNRDLAHAETVLLLVYFMYILLNNSVALTFAVNPKSLGGRVQPISIEVLSLPLSSNHHEVFFSPKCVLLQNCIHRTKEVSKTFSSLSLTPLTQFLQNCLLFLHLRRILKAVCLIYWQDWFASWMTEIRWGQGRNRYVTGVIPGNRSSCLQYLLNPWEQ